MITVVVWWWIVVSVFVYCLFLWGFVGVVGVVVCVGVVFGCFGVGWCMCVCWCFVWLVGVCVWLCVCFVCVCVCVCVCVVLGYLCVFSGVGGL